jgi:hypothetical protein
MAWFLDGVRMLGSSHCLGGLVPRRTALRTHKPNVQKPSSLLRRKSQPKFAGCIMGLKYTAEKIAPQDSNDGPGLWAANTRGSSAPSQMTENDPTRPFKLADANVGYRNTNQTLLVGECCDDRERPNPAIQAR